MSLSNSTTSSDAAATPERLLETGTPLTLDHKTILTITSTAVIGVSPLLLGACALEDACDDARERAEEGCRSEGLVPVNCRETKHEQELFKEECEYVCECRSP